jgi:hypothetical protein
MNLCPVWEGMLSVKLGFRCLKDSRDVRPGGWDWFQGLMGEQAPCA